MSITSQQEAFAQAVASGKSNAEAYRTAYPNAHKWTAQSVATEAYKIAVKPDVSRRIEQIRAELAEKGLWTREQSAKALIGVVNSPDKASDVVAAVKELNAMHGYNEPLKIDHSGSVKIITRRIIG